HANVIDAAAAADVKHLVYTSAPAATTSALILAPEHKATEEAIAASGTPATILRNNWYTENYLSTIDQARATGEIVSSAGDGRVASASRKDYAAAAAAALLSPETTGHTFELSGDTAWHFSELAAVATQITGRPVAYRAVTPEQHA